MVNPIKLSPRLMLAYEKVPQNANYIDIGTDHGYLPAALLLANRIKKAVVTDINSAPLEKAMKTAKNYNLCSRMEFINTSGLNFDFGSPDAISICGMGGLLIAEIINQFPLPEECILLLQPMTKKEELRRSLCRHGYFFDESYVVEGKQVFVMIRAFKSQKPNIYDEISIFAGYPEKSAEKSSEYKKYLDSVIARVKKRRDGLLSSKDEAKIILAKQSDYIYQKLKERRKDLNED